MTLNIGFNGAICISCLIKVDFPFLFEINFLQDTLTEIQTQWNNAEHPEPPLCYHLRGVFLLALTNGAFLFTTLSKHRGSFLCSETSSGSRPIVKIQDPPRNNNKMYPRPTGWSDKVQQRQSTVLFNFAGFSYAKPNLYWFFLQRHLTCCIHSVGSLRLTLLS